MQNISHIVSPRKFDDPLVDYVPCNGGAARQWETWAAEMGRRIVAEHAGAGATCVLQARARRAGRGCRRAARRRRGVRRTTRRGRTSDDPPSPIVARAGGAGSWPTPGGGHTGDGLPRGGVACRPARRVPRPRDGGDGAAGQTIAGCPAPPTRGGRGGQRPPRDGRDRPAVAPSLDTYAISPRGVSFRRVAGRNVWPGGGP